MMKEFAKDAKMLYWNEEADQFVRIEAKNNRSDEMIIAGAPEIQFETEHELI
jgi:hypothetical protein